MGIGFVLLFWGIVGVALTVVGSFVSKAAAEHLASGIRNPYEKKNVVNAVRFAPLLYLGWLVVVFIFQSFVNLGIMHRDIGLGDGFDCPLSNGYALSGIDVTDHMRLYNPATLPGGSGAVGDRTDAVDDVVEMQVSGTFVAGASANDLFKRSFTQAGYLKPNSFFIVDTRNGTQKHYKSKLELRAAATKIGFKLDLRPINEIYSDNRISWFDFFILFLQVGAPVLYLLELRRRIRAVRNKPWF